MLEFKSFTEKLKITFTKKMFKVTKISDERFEGLRGYMEESRSATGSSHLRLLIAAKIVEKMREAVYNETTFRCSAGVSHNKVKLHLL